MLKAGLEKRVCFSKFSRRRVPITGPDAGAGGVRCCFVPMCFTEDVAMRTFDFSPFARNAIGFETLFDRLNDRSYENQETYPPYDIVRKGEDAFQINLALAGFSSDDISITSEASQLTVTGKTRKG